MFEMGGVDIPSPIRDFIFRYIDSVELLNVLLLLHSNSDRTWTVAEITTELRSSNGSIEKRLHDLYHRQVLSRGVQDEAGHRFTPASEGIRDLVNQLAEFYRNRPTTLIETIYARPAEAIKAFAEAFKFKGDN